MDRGGPVMGGGVTGRGKLNESCKQEETENTSSPAQILLPDSADSYCLTTIKVLTSLKGMPIARSLSIPDF